MQLPFQPFSPWLICLSQSPVFSGLTSNLWSPCLSRVHMCAPIPAQPSLWLLFTKMCSPGSSFLLFTNMPSCVVSHSLFSETHPCQRSTLWHAEKSLLGSCLVLVCTGYPPGPLGSAYTENDHRPHLCLCVQVTGVYILALDFSSSETHDLELV